MVRVYWGETMSISDNVLTIKTQVDEAARRVNRDPASIKIIAVTKYVDTAAMNAVIRAGIPDIGENRIQDAIVKFPMLQGNVTKHLIGSLQTNKVKTALAEFDLIHSVDRPELVRELAKQAEKLGMTVRFLIQLNISGEATKHGLEPAGLSELLKLIQEYRQLIPCGLMTIAPLAENAAAARPVFQRLNELFHEAAVRFNLGPSWQYLSMGMSQDFEVAIEEGANLVRIGSAIFR